MGEVEKEVGVHEIAFEAFGVRALVSLSPADHPDRLAALLPPGWQPCAPSAVGKRFQIRADASGAYQLLRDDDIYTKGLDLDLALELLEAQVRAHVALHAPDRIFVHAGAIAHEGRAIVIPGMSFAGKTTLVAAFVRAGAVYYSDEFTVLDEDGLVYPYPKPLSLRGGDLRQTDHEVESLGGVAGADPLRIGAIVVTAYRPSAEWQPRRLTPGEGVLAMLSNTVPARERPQQALRAISRAVEGAIVLEGHRGEADAVVPQVLAELSPEAT